MSEPLVCLICHEGLPKDLDLVIYHIETNHPEVSIQKMSRRERAVAKVEMKHRDHIIHPEVPKNGKTKESH